MVSDKEFERLLLLAQAPLSIYCRKLTRHRERAEDLLQDTNVRAWTKRHLYKSDDNFTAWIKTVARNYYTNQVKKEALLPMKTVPISWGDGTHDNGSETTLSNNTMPAYDTPIPPNQEDYWLENRIMEAIAELPPQTALLIQKKLQGMTYQQLAAPLGIKANNAKQRYFNDIKVLRQRLLDLGLLE